MAIDCGRIIDLNGDGNPYILVLVNLKAMHITARVLNQLNREGAKSPGAEWPAHVIFLQIL
jgi:hypothetical protein